MSTIYTTISDYIAQEVAPALGEWKDDYDMEAIAHDMLEWHSEPHPLGGINANTFGLIAREDVDFWDVAERHENTNQD
ncbi:hypothetical protein [Corynebacterium macclintockiae]|uniref:hypothetical protein n=1 Tax=Corynebacterium macclintockiae TaxID=2913501 RepID=UPI003EBADB71